MKNVLTLLAVSLFAATAAQAASNLDAASNAADAQATQAVDQVKSEAKQDVKKEAKQAKKVAAHKAVKQAAKAKKATM